MGGLATAWLRSAAPNSGPCFTASLRPPPISPSPKAPGLHEAVSDLLREHKPEECALETLFFSKNTKTALKVAEARGVIRLALISARVPELECSCGCEAGLDGLPAGPTRAR